ncbi:hypothetical protein [Spiroplasma kunkelii]|uniref:hypothetical protein n=1 Tax=Spiroplasma kunkelii TaxID=47834 RepID=UPI000AFBBA91|nr:hypothetical protein [Spiroplasma kunkelii]
MFFNGAKRQRAERVCKFQFFNFLEGSYIVPTWLTIIFRWTLNILYQVNFQLIKSIMFMILLMKKKISIRICLW